MNRRPLGRSGCQVSELCFGTLNFGWRVGETQAAALLDAFHEAGGDFIQATSIGGGGGVPLGLTEASEDYVGRWWRDRRVVRERLFLATRLVLQRPRGGGALALEAIIRRACENSLQRFRTHCLDLVLVEWCDGLVPLDDVLLGLERLKRAGLVRYVGAAGFPAWRLMESVHRSQQRDFERFEVAQLELSWLAGGPMQQDVLRLCREYRLGVLARSPLAGGALARRGAAEGRPDDGARAALGEWAVVQGLTVPQAALAWVMAQPAVTAPVLGVSSVEHLHDLIAVSRLGPRLPPVPWPPPGDAGQAVSFIQPQPPNSLSVS